MRLNQQMTEESELKCVNKGCNKKYKESENTDEICEYHTGLPIFHDFKKGWTCCNQIVYSWEEFQQLKGCTKGRHSNKKVEQDQDFFKSQTVSQAKKGLENNPDQPKLKNIRDFTKEMNEKKETEEKPKEIVYTPDGKFKCSNKGCNKAYTEEDNQSENVCEYHSGEPVFHDLKKYWSCCKKETWDWDSFMKLPTCAKGQHVPKMKQLIQQ